MPTYKIAFSLLKGMCPELAQKILDIIPGEEYFFKMSENELAQNLGFKHKILNDDYRRQLVETASREVDFINKNGITVTYFTDNNYPARFLSAPDAPILFYSKGICELNSSKIISIVGTRNATIYGRNFCDTLIRELSEKLDDIIVVSGLAYGIDISSHMSALKYNIPTVAVLAHGLNTIYPASHRNSAVEIIKHNGMLLTEYTSQDRILKHNFIARNRIVAALADCTIVVESAEKGGAMITAGIAGSYNRDVFAVPGRTSDQYSAGCNRLIKNQSACMITCADDIIRAMNWETKCHNPKEMQLFPDITEEEQTVINVFAAENELHINKLNASLDMPVSKILSLLIELEFKGVIQTLPGARYMKVKNNA